MIKNKMRIILYVMNLRIIGLVTDGDFKRAFGQILIRIIQFQTWKKSNFFFKVKEVNRQN